MVRQISQHLFWHCLHVQTESEQIGTVCGWKRDSDKYLLGFVSLQRILHPSNVCHCLAWIPILLLAIDIEFIYIYTRIAYNLTSYQRGKRSKWSRFRNVFCFISFRTYRTNMENISRWLIAEQIFFGISTGWKSTPTRKVDNASSTRCRCAISAWQFHIVLQLLLNSYFFASSSPFQWLICLTHILISVLWVSLEHCFYPFQQMTLTTIHWIKTKHKDSAQFLEIIKNL